MEPMFDNDSFRDEITNASEAQSAYSYYAHNLTAFRHELADAGCSHSEIEKQVRQCWINLIKSSQRVGYLNGHMERTAKAYGLGVNRALVKNALPK